MSNRTLLVSLFLYTDPGNGALLVQLLLGSAIGFLYSVRHKFSALIAFWKRKQGGPSASAKG